MKTKVLSLLTTGLALIALAAGSSTARASIAYGSVNNFDTVNDTGHECHGFEIELDDCHSTDVTYTYNYNHYGVPNITEDNSVPAHPKVIIRWESKKNANGTWAAYTAIPAGPIAPTNGHMFTNPAVNFGGEHFGVGYKVQPSAVLYNWLIDNGLGGLAHGGAVQVSTPTFTYYPPVAAAPPQVVAVIVPPPPPAPPPQQFGKAVWVKEIKTTTHNANKVKLRDLVSDDPANPNDKNWKNGEPDQVEVEWRILQKNSGLPDGGVNNNVPAAPEALPDGDEVITRRYEFYKYVGPLDAETGEAMGDAVGADGLHGTGSRTYADHFSFATYEWVTVTTDMTTQVVVGEFTGAQMAAVDVREPVGLIDHVGEGKVNKAFAPRSVVVEGALPFVASQTGVLPPGLAFNAVTGVLSGTPTTSGTYNFKVTASDGTNPDVAKNYSMTIAAVGAALPAKYLLDTTASPVGSGTTTGDGSFDPGTNATATAVPTAGFVFLNWTDNGVIVSTNPSYTLAMDVNHSLVANFVPDVVQWNIATSAAPVAGGTVTGGGLVDDGTNTTVVATANAGYTFTNWTVGATQVSASASYTFTVTASKALVANFSAIGSTPRTVTTSSSPVAGGSTTGGGTYADGTSVTVNATPNIGYIFSKWKVGSTTVSSTASYTFTLTADRTLVASFTPVFYITANASPIAGGTTEMDSVSYKVGETAQARVKTTAAGYQFVNWTENGTVVSTVTPYSFTVTGNRTIVANFSQIGVTNYTITTSAAPVAGGTTSGGGTFASGTNVNLLATPNVGYVFSSWTQNATVVSSTASYSFVASATVSLVANFVVAPTQWTISASALPAPGGTVTGGGLVDDGSQVTLSAVASPGYTFSKWTEGASDISTSPNYSFTATADRTLVANFTLTSTGVKFDFDATTTPVALGQTLPFDQTSAGVTATFDSPNGSAFTIGDAISSTKSLATLTGKYLMGSAAGDVLTVTLNQQVTAASLNFALLEPLNLAPHSTLKLTAIDNLTTPGTPAEVGSATASGTNHAGDSLATGTLSFGNGQAFDQIRIEVLTPAQAGSTFFVDCINVIPLATGGGSFTLANPNWNITLTDAGYSDLLLDNTPGFVGREYLSGEWGAAVGYKVGNTTRSPRWLERNFIYPDWTTNSDFTVVSPMSLIGSNADGLPITQSVIANNDIEITIRCEMIDTVVGMPMGAMAASNADPAGNSMKSNRYILNQSYTVKNISGSAISNLQLFQMLHGLTSQHGAYDNRAYAGKHSEYQYDVTLGGVDAFSIGAAGASSTGFEDFIGFGAKLAPSAYEIGHYGIDTVDNHGIGKPSVGVHLSIEDNWTGGSLATKNRDYFAPANQWVAGAQRYEFGTIADGQSATVDVMLSILTGTTVTITGGGGGGGNHGTGSCNGGSTHVGGVDFDIEGITQEGTFFGTESEADDTEVNERIADGEFVLPNFAEPGGLSQVWNLKYNGTYTGLIKLTFNYDPALLPAGFEGNKLTIWHFTNGAWEQLIGKVDAVNHTITVTTSSLSPFMLGVQTAHAMPQINLSAPAPGTQQLQWTSDTTGWVLEESADLTTWTPSAQAVNTVGNVSTVTINGAGACCFFRLAHP